MPNVQPYKIFPLDENTSVFVTDNEITYFIEFFSYSYMFPAKAKLGSIYTFNFYPSKEEAKERIKTDGRIKATILDILTGFFKENNTALVTICDSTDSKEMYRHKLFDKWFVELEAVFVEKYDCKTIIEGTTLYNSLLIHSKHPNKQKAIDYFYKMNDNEFLPLEEWFWYKTG